MTKSKISLIGKTTSQSVEKHTGKTWDYWIAQLKKENAQALTHKEIVALLNTKYKIKNWWQQIVSTGFEIHIGRKKEGQNEKGEYQVTVTKSLPISQKDCWAFLASEEGLRIWLQPMSEFHLQKGESFEVIGGIYGEVRTIKAPEKVRMTWHDSDWPKKSVVQLYVAKQPKNKCIFIIMHEQLANPRIKEKQRAFWKERVSELALALPATTSAKA